MEDHSSARIEGRFTREDEEAGAREAFEDAVLYDFEYRRRRLDVNFYRRLAHDRAAFAGPAPILDLACGSGRVAVPLLRDGHTVVGLDRSRGMLARAAWRIDRLPASRRRQAALVRGDLRSFAFPPRFGLAICAFHSVQHLMTAGALGAFLRRARTSLRPGGWLAFDVLPPDPAWIHRDPTRRWARTVFRHPSTGERLIYTTSHAYDPRRRALHMGIFLQPIDAHGRPSAPERVMRLCHRQWTVAEVTTALRRAGFKLFATTGDFAGGPIADGCDQYVFAARTRGRPDRP